MTVNKSCCSWKNKQLIRDSCKLLQSRKLLQSISTFLSTQCGGKNTQSNLSQIETNYIIPTKPKSVQCCFVLIFIDKGLKTRRQLLRGGGGVACSFFLLLLHRSLSVLRRPYQDERKSTKDGNTVSHSSLMHAHFSTRS